MRIESPRNRLVRFARSLHGPKGRGETGLFLAEGPAIVAEALLYAPDIEWVAWRPVATTEDAEALAEAAAESGIKVYVMSERAFAAISATRSPQGIAAIIRIPLADLGMIRCRPEAETILILHDLRDPGNVGAMIRTADALGAGGVILTGSCADPHDPKVVRATAGSLFHLPVIEADWRQVVGWARDEKLSLVAAAADVPHVLGKAGFPPRAAIVIGNEARGLPDDVLQDAAMQVRIPMPGRAESLNAAVAAGIMLYEALRARGR